MKPTAYDSFSPGDESICALFNTPLQIALGQATDKGGAAAQALATDMIRQFNPGFIMLAGIAGGLGEREISLYDIIVARNVFDYEGERLQADGSGMRPKPYSCDPVVHRIVNHLKATGMAHDILGENRIHQKDFAAGSKLFADPNTPLREKIMGISDTVVGFEMESHGVLHSVWEAAMEKRIACGVVKSVSDLGGDDKKEGENEKQTEAASRAARLTLEILCFIKMDEQ